MDKNKFSISTDTINIKFSNIKQVRNKIRERFVKIQKVRNTIRENYQTYITKEKQDFFGLDSFHFQNKVLDLEFDNMGKLYQFIDNRIYGDYYKLFNDIGLFLKENLKSEQILKIQELKNNGKYPIYKDLETFKTYDFETINMIHHDIIQILSNSLLYYHENEKAIREDMKKIGLGLNIENYIINLQYKNSLLLTTIKKFQNCLQVYNKYHYDMLSKFNEKLTLCFHHIEHTKQDDRFYSDSSEESHSSFDGDNDDNNFEISDFMKPSSENNLTKSDTKIDELLYQNEENIVTDNDNNNDKINSFELHNASLDSINKEKDGFTVVTSKHATNKKKRKKKKK